jgi:hypothetical protein
MANKMIDLFDFKNESSKKFDIQTIVYSNDSYSIAYGNWENSDFKFALSLKSKNTSSTSIIYWTLLPLDTLLVSKLVLFLDKIENLERKLDLFEILILNKL